MKPRPRPRPRYGPERASRAAGRSGRSCRYRLATAVTKRAICGTVGGRVRATGNAGGALAVAQGARRRRRAHGRRQGRGYRRLRRGLRYRRGAPGRSALGSPCRPRCGSGRGPLPRSGAPGGTCASPLGCWQPVARWRGPVRPARGPGLAVTRPRRSWSASVRYQPSWWCPGRDRTTAHARRWSVCCSHEFQCGGRRGTAKLPVDRASERRPACVPFRTGWHQYLAARPFVLLRPRGQLVWGHLRGGCSTSGAMGRTS